MTASLLKTAAVWTINLALFCAVYQPASPRNVTEIIIGILAAMRKA